MKNKYLREIKKALSYNNEQALEDIFESVYYEYSSLVHYIALRIVKKKGIAEEITQEVFMRFFNNIKTTEFRNIKYWLSTTAKNLSLNYIKNKDSSIIYNDEAILYLYDEYKDNTKAIIDELYEILTAEEVDIIIMHLIYKFTFKEIANDMNVSTDSIKGKYRRAIIKYKKTNK